MDDKPTFLGNYYGGGTSFDGAVYDILGLCPTLLASNAHGNVPKFVEVIKLNDNDIKRLGNYFGEEFGTGYAGNVYDSNGVAPTLQSMQGGGRQPHIVEVKAIDEQNMIVRDESVGTLTTDGSSPKHNNRVAEVQQIVAMRGRGEDNVQQLEPNNTGTSNTLTSVAKDNLVLEGKEVAALRMQRTEEGKALRKDYESGKIHHGFNEYREAVPREDGCANTLSTVNKDNMLVEPAKIKIRQATKDGFIDCEIGGVADLNYPTSQTRRGRVQEDGNISPTLTTENIPSVIELADPEFYNFLYMIDGSVYLIRIRKLIPKECWRLMGISDEDFEKAEKVNSSSQLYKQAGNAIVVNVLEAMYKNLFMREERQHD